MRWNLFFWPFDYDFYVKFSIEEFPYESVFRHPDDERLNTDTVSRRKNGNVSKSVRPRQAKDTLETAGMEKL